MLTYKRKYNFTGKIILNRSRVLDLKCNPKDDIVNWLFLDTGKQQLSFIYKIDNPNEARYNIPFEIKMAFTMPQKAIRIIQLNNNYRVFRGQENIGSVTINKII
jgi:hypothetical protein